LWYVYFLELSNVDLYIGSTNDLRRRFTSHQNGYVVCTREHLPAVRSYVAVADEATARSLERYFKSGSGKAFAKKRLLATAHLQTAHDEQRAAQTKARPSHRSCH
jgi:putative endonuclease